MVQDRAQHHRSTSSCAKIQPEAQQTATTATQPPRNERICSAFTPLVHFGAIVASMPCPCLGSAHTPQPEDAWLC